MYGCTRQGLWSEPRDYPAACCVPCKDRQSGSAGSASRHPFLFQGNTMALACPHTSRRIAEHCQRHARGQKVVRELLQVRTSPGTDCAGPSTGRLQDSAAGKQLFPRSHHIAAAVASGRGRRNDNDFCSSGNTCGSNCAHRTDSAQIVPARPLAASQHRIRQK